MHFSTLVAVLASCIATAQADCYTSGDTWAPDQVQANGVLDDVCNNVSGNIGAGATNYACRNAGSPNKRFDFYVKNVADGDRSVSKEECVLRLSNEINGCQNGGITTTGDFEFR
jgi:hypothetical protein